MATDMATGSSMFEVMKRSTPWEGWLWTLGMVLLVALVCVLVRP